MRNYRGINILPANETRTMVRVKLAPATSRGRCRDRRALLRLSAAAQRSLL